MQGWSLAALCSTRQHSQSEAPRERIRAPLSPKIPHPGQPRASAFHRAPRLPYGHVYASLSLCLISRQPGSATTAFATPASYPMLTLRFFPSLPPQIGHGLCHRNVSRLADTRPILLDRMLQETYAFSCGWLVIGVVPVLRSLSIEDAEPSLFDDQVVAVEYRS
jgi:hypothetical protein